MSLDKKLFKSVATTSTTTIAAQGLVVHLDANDEDSIEQGGDNTGAGSGIWFDIANHDLNVPLSSDDNNNLKIHYDPSDTNSYSGSGTTLTNLAGNSLNATVVASRFNNDYDSGLKGYFDISTQSEATIVIPNGHPLNGDFTLEFWFRWQGTPVSGGHRFINESGQNIQFFYYKPHGWRFYQASGQDTGYYGGSSGGIQGNVWQHKVITFSGTQFKGYLDGNQIGSKTYTRPSSSLGSFNFGTTNITADKPDCDIGAIRMYDRALTASEVGQNFRAGNYFNYSSIITSKHEATEGNLYTSSGSQYTYMQVNLNANEYSGSGNSWQDSSGLGRNATINAATYVDDNNSDYFDFAGNTSDPVSISNFSGLNSSARTWEFWVWFDTDATNYFGGMWGTNSDNSTKMAIFRMKDSNNAIRASVYDGTGSAVEPTTANNVVKTNEWNHIVFTSDNSDNSFEIYVNGVEKYSSTLSFDINTSSTEDFIIGAGGSYSSNRLDGRVAQFRYYNTALSASEVMTNYNASREIYKNPTVLTDLRPTNYSSGTTWNDSSNQGNNATLNNFGSTVTSYYDKEIGNFFDLESNDYFSTSITKNWASIPFSVEMWFNTDSRNGEYLWGFNDTVGNGVGASIRGSGNSYHLQFLGSGLIVSAGVVQTNQWYHLVFTSDGATKKAYLNGSFVDSGTTTINSAANGKAFIFGRYGTANAGYYNGKMGHVRLYEGELSDAQVAQNYLATKNKYPNGINGDIQGATFQSSATPFHFDFNGSTNYIDVPLTTLGDGDFTITMYIKFDDLSPQRYIFTKYISSPPGAYGMLVQSQASRSDVLWQMFDTGNGTPIGIYSSTSLSTGTYYHFAFVYVKETSATIYLNGSSDGTTSYATSNPFAQNSDPIRFGRYGGGTNSHDGEIGQIKIFEKALSASEVLDEYNATKSIYIP